ncbi:hypothetical protein TWF191_002885 [Orbilia oligospora]|uniref:CNNM transmembrane domain-containing protein n=1 Tax=Orbilia oligospora TaxID=2813651 RepID=A0A7C8QB29_ORBOL|nr:hypothetical protein TWF191_002885 [Orbilia oligospora]
MMFRAAAYTDIINHILKSKMAMNASASAAAAAAATTNPVLQEMSLSEKSAKIATVIGLVFALIAVVVIASLVTASTLSVLAFNKIYLRVIADSGNDREQQYARMVLNLRRRPYNMICAFVFTGSAMAELIPLLISLIMQEISEGTVSGNLNALSIVIAVALVIVFVELLPLGYTVRKALFVNTFLIRFAQLLLWIWYPVTYPIDWTLDKIYQLRLRSNQHVDRQPRFANTEERFFRNEELTRFVELHARPVNPPTIHEGGDVHKTVPEILKGAFRVQNLKAKDIMHSWRDFRIGTEVFYMDSKVNRQMALGLFGYGVNGAVLMEVEDPLNPDYGKDIDMVPLNGKKKFVSDIAEDETRAKFLSREVMPVVYDCFGDLLELFCLLHHGSCKMALVVTTPPAKNDKGRANIPPCSDYAVSKTRIFWTNQPHISAYVKPIGVIAYQSLLKAILKYLSQSTYKMPDPMDRFKPHRWNTQEKLAEIDKMYEEIAAREEAERKAAAEKEAAEREAAEREANIEKEVAEREAAEREAAETVAYGQDQGTATGIFDRILSLGTRRRKGVVDNGKSPVGSSRGSIFEAMGTERVNDENDSETET